MEIISSQWDFYVEYKKYLGLGYIHNTAHEFRLALLSPSYTPDIINHAIWDDINSNEISSYSYPIGGVSIFNLQYTLNEIEARYYWSANDVIFYLGELVDIKYAVIYDNSPVNNPLVCWSYLDNTEATVSANNVKVKLGNIYKI